MTPDPFDPVTVFRVFEQERLAYVLIGTLAGVLHGTGETTREIEICLRIDPRNVERFAAVLQALNTVPTAEEPTLRLDPTDTTPHRFKTPHGTILTDPDPPGTRGWDDLRRRAERLLVDTKGTRIPVAATEDLLRIITTRDLEADRQITARYRLLNELERTLDLGMSL
jgi:hypothetical protein